MMCFGLKDRKRLKTNHCVIVLLDDTQLVHELHVSIPGECCCFGWRFGGRVRSQDGAGKIYWRLGFRQVLAGSNSRESHLRAKVVWPQATGRAACN